MRTRLVYTVWTFEEEIVPSVGWRYIIRIQDGKVADSRKNKILEDRGRCGGGRDDKDTGGLERALARGSP